MRTKTFLFFFSFLIFTLIVPLGIFAAVTDPQISNEAKNPTSYIYQHTNVTFSADVTPGVDVPTPTLTWVRLYREVDDSTPDLYSVMSGSGTYSVTIAPEDFSGSDEQTVYWYIKALNSNGHYAQTSTYNFVIRDRTPATATNLNWDANANDIEATISDNKDTTPNAWTAIHKNEESDWIWWNAMSSGTPYYDDIGAHDIGDELDYAVLCRDDEYNYGMGQEGYSVDWNEGTLEDWEIRSGFNSMSYKSDTAYQVLDCYEAGGSGSAWARIDTDISINTNTYYGFVIRMRTTSTVDLQFYGIYDDGQGGESNGYLAKYDDSAGEYLDSSINDWKFRSSDGYVWFIGFVDESNRESAETSIALGFTHNNYPTDNLPSCHVYIDCFFLFDPETFAIVDTESPVLTNPSRDPTNPDYLEAINFTVTITDNVDVTSAFFYHRPYENGYYTEIEMSEGANDVWSCTLPAETYNYDDNIQYYYLGKDALNNQGNTAADNVTLVDNTNPLLSNPLHSPTTPHEENSITFYLDVTDGDGSGISWVKVHYKINSGTFLNTLMELDSGTTYKELWYYDIQLEDEIQYYFSCEDNDGNIAYLYSDDYATTVLSDAWDFNEGDTETLLWHTNTPATVTHVDGKLRCEVTSVYSNDFYLKFDPILYPNGDNYDLFVIKVKSNIAASIKLVQHTGDYRQYATVQTYSDETFRVETCSLSYASDMISQGIRLRFRINTGSLAIGDYFEIDYIFLNELHDFTVTDQTNPDLSNPDHHPDTVTYLDTIYLSITSSDNGDIDTVITYYRINSGDWILINSSVEGLVNQSIGIHNTADFIEYWFWTNDTAGNEFTLNNGGAYYSFTVIDNIAPTFSDISSVPSVPLPTDNVTIYAMVGDESTISEVRCYWRDNGGQSSWIYVEMTWNGTGYYCYLGFHVANVQVEYYIWAKDQYNNVDNTGIYYFTPEDNTAPNIFALEVTPAIVQPDDSITIYVNVTDEHSNIYYVKFYYKEQSEGSYIWIYLSLVSGKYTNTLALSAYSWNDTVLYYIIASDTASNLNDTMSSSPLNFTISDYTNPTLTNVQLTSAFVNETIYPAFSAEASDSLSGLNYVRAYLRVDGSSFNYETMSWFETAYKVTWSSTFEIGQLIEYYFTSTDNAGNVETNNNSGTYYSYTIIDTQSPVIHSIILSPITPRIETDNIVILAHVTDNDDLSDISVKLYWKLVDTSSWTIADFTLTDERFSYTFNIFTETATYDYYVLANDTGNNIDQSEIKQFSIYELPPGEPIDPVDPIIPPTGPILPVIPVTPQQQTAIYSVSGSLLLLSLVILMVQRIQKKKKKDELR